MRCLRFFRLVKGWGGMSSVVFVRSRGSSLRLALLYYVKKHDLACMWIESQTIIEVVCRCRTYHI